MIQTFEEWWTEQRLQGLAWDCDKALAALAFEAGREAGYEKGQEVIAGFSALGDV